MVRGDSHYATPEVLDLLEETHCTYILGLSTNRRLAPMAQPWTEDTATRRALSKKDRFWWDNFRKTLATSWD